MISGRDARGPLLATPRAAAKASFIGNLPVVRDNLSRNFAIEVVILFSEFKRGCFDAFLASATLRISILSGRCGHVRFRTSITDSSGTLPSRQAIQAAITWCQSAAR